MTYRKEWRVDSPKHGIRAFEREDSVVGAVQRRIYAKDYPVTVTKPDGSKVVWTKEGEDDD